MAEYDEPGYYEIQLNNKQLVFFFMAAVAIAVVVFLCGVMVGRGVHNAAIGAAGGDIASVPDAAALSEREVTPSEVRGELDYQERLESAEVDDTLEGTSSSPEKLVAEAASKPAPAEPPPARAAPAVAKPTGAASGSSKRIGLERGTFTIQVSALRTREAAEKLVGRLGANNYRAYVESGGGTGLYRVRVGWFATRAEAEQVAQKLRDEWKFDPYITQ